MWLSSLFPQEGQVPYSYSISEILTQQRPHSVLFTVTQDKTKGCARRFDGSVQQFVRVGDADKARFELGGREIDALFEHGVKEFSVKRAVTL